MRAHGGTGVVCYTGDVAVPVIAGVVSWRHGSRAACGADDMDAAGAHELGDGVVLCGEAAMCVLMVGCAVGYTYVAANWHR